MKAPGKSNALNAALELAEGELLVFTDDDVAPAEDWLAELLKASTDWPNDNVFGGVILPEYAGGTPAWLQQSRYAPAAFAQFKLDIGPGPMP